MKEKFDILWNGLPKPIKEVVHGMLAGAGIGALTGGTAVVFKKLNVQHPAEPPKPHYQPPHPKQTPRWQPRHDYHPKRNWSQEHRNRQAN